MRAILLLAIIAALGAVEEVAIVTAYTGHDPGCTGITKTGVVTADHPDGIAVDGAHIPVGASISVPGYRGGAFTTADDTGGAMRKDWKRGVVHIDLRFATRDEAMQWGRQHLTITIR